MLGGRTLQSSCESGPHASYDGDKRRHGAKVHLAVDTLGHGMDPSVTLDDEQERAQVKELCEAVQETTGNAVQVAWVNQGYTGQASATAGTIAP